MTSTKLNVLIYNGPGATGESLRHAFSTLRRLLTPTYAVAPLSDTALLREPWGPTCALLVMPGGADLGYCRLLNGAGTSCIREYVRHGGSYLGLCAGGYFGSARCEFELGSDQPGMEVVGPRELAFFPGTCRGGAFRGFQYKSEAGARAARTATGEGEAVLYYNGGGVFVNAGSMKEQNVEVLASYLDDTDVDGGADGGKAAVVHCRVGEGNACLMGTHPEFAADNLHSHPEIPHYDKLVQALAAGDEGRNAFLAMCLAKLGLAVNEKPAVPPTISRLHLSSLGRSEVVELMFSLQSHMSKEDGHELLRGGDDCFRCLPSESSPGDAVLGPGGGHAARRPVDSCTRENGDIDYSEIVKDVVYHDGGWPDKLTCPKFDHELFYNSIRAFQAAEEEDIADWGRVLLYGEVVTSTNSLLERNPKLLSQLQTGFTFAATTQVAGRGRGSNIWVTPDGCLPFSVVINHPAYLGASHPIVFVQYIAAIAVAEAIHTYDAGYGHIAVKLKWPNDIYALDPNSPAHYPSYVKIGGILSNCVYTDGNYQIVLGIGLNVRNGRPTTSLDALLPRSSDGSVTPPFSPFRPERLLARIVTRLGALYSRFRREGFSADLEAAYYRHWLHNNQVVTLEADGGSFRGRVLGITTDWGMLKVEEVDDRGNGTGKAWALQSDENSFDYWRGLVRRKI